MKLNFKFLLLCLSLVEESEVQGLPNHPPHPICQGINVRTDSGTCVATIQAETLDGGSSDQDNDPLTFSFAGGATQHSFPVGTYANVKVLVSDGQATRVCTSTITVRNESPAVEVQDGQRGPLPIIVECLNGTLSQNVSLSGSVIDPDNTDSELTASWSNDCVPPSTFSISDPSSFDTIMVVSGNISEQICDATLTVTDICGATGDAIATFSVEILGCE
jgi:hypothetical protein